MEVKTKKYANLFEIYHRNALNNPQSNYIEQNKSHYTYAECNEIINKIASYLQNKHWRYI
ncbi:hypothetical protein IMCC3317_08100 [Kordia antarctica]|uniref:Uncharacterized protein n=1 Tax=Kordia antarctica TaxID=1218801 RepID=A0A7L4ZHR3_9FLAO|nr:hypothetical protein IMCC3317_08100 [Kordia antarctica]